MKNKWIWVTPIVIIAIFSQDYWSWGNIAAETLWGFPCVVTYFFTLQILLASAIWLFTKKYWQE